MQNNYYGQPTAGEKTASERASLIQASQAIIADVKAAGRGLRPSETAILEKNSTAIKALDDLAAERAASDARIRAVESLGYPAGLGERTPFNTAETAKGLVDALSMKQGYTWTLPIKAPVGVGPGAGNANLPSAGSQVSPVPLGSVSVSLRDFFGTPVNAGGPKVRYYRMNPSATGAGIVAEGEVKPDLSLGITPVDADLIKLACTQKCTDELLMDAVGLVDALNTEMVRELGVKENEVIRDALAAGAGVTYTDFDLTGAIDGLGHVIGTTEATNGVTPRAVLMNPADVATLRAQKATDSGVYFLDPLGAGPTTLHGVPVHSAPAIPAGEAYVLTDGFGSFHVRGGVQIQAGLTGDDLVRNQFTTVAEERILPAVQRPALVSRVLFGGDESSSS